MRNSKLVMILYVHVAALLGLITTWLKAPKTVFGTTSLIQKYKYHEYNIKQTQIIKGKSLFTILSRNERNLFLYPTVICLML